MVNTVINALIAGILGAISISVTHTIVSGENTTNWSPATQSMFGLIPTVVGIVVIVGMFVLLSQIRGAGA